MNDAQLTKMIHKYVEDNFGSSEANNPSWSIAPLAQAIKSSFDERTQAAARLEYLREELQAERISYGELAELQELAPFIDGGDMELLEAAGIPEDFANRQCKTCGDVLPQKQHDHRPEITLQVGWYCCDEYYCSEPCLYASFNSDLAEGYENWSEHYSDDGDCYFTEWESEV